MFVGQVLSNGDPCISNDPLKNPSDCFYELKINKGSVELKKMMPGMLLNDNLLSDIDKEPLQKAFKSEFDARNLKYVQSGGEMLVSLYIFLDVKSDSTTYSDFVVMSGMTPLETTIYGDDYEEGTLILTCYDAKETTLIFSVTKIKTIQEDPSKREKTIPKAVGKLMRKFPIKKSK